MEVAAMGKASKIRFTGEPGQEQCHVEVPAKVARRLPFKIDDNVEWIVVDEDTVLIRRTDEPFLAVKKNPASITRLF